MTDYSHLNARCARWASAIEAGASAFSVSGILLAAVMEHETWGGDAPHYSPQGSPAGLGDNGHGHGLWQIDDRSHASFLGTKNDLGQLLWTFPQFQSLYVAALMRRNLDRFLGDPLPAIAAFNAGAGAAHAALAKLAPDAPRQERINALDSVTKNANYVSKVLENIQDFSP